jgi:hypothetical protein
MRPGAALITRAIEQPPVTGGLLPGVTALWWRAPTPDEEWRARGLLRVMHGPLDEDLAATLLDFCASMVCGWWGRAEGEDDLAPIGDPLPCRFQRGVSNIEQALPWLPWAFLDGHHEVLIYAVTQAIGLRALASITTAATPRPPPPDGVVAVPTCLGWLGVRPAHWPRLARSPGIRLRCLQVALAPWQDGEPDEDADRASDTDWLLLMSDVAAGLSHRVVDGEWVEVVGVARPELPGVWTGSLTARDLADCWRAMMGPALDAAGIVRDWLPVRSDERTLPPLPSAGVEPWLEDEAYRTLGPEARAWARAAWAHALQQQAAALGRPVVG